MQEAMHMYYPTTLRSSSEGLTYLFLSFWISVIHPHLSLGLMVFFEQLFWLFKMLHKNTRTYAPLSHYNQLFSKGSIFNEIWFNVPAPSLSPWELDYFELQNITPRSAYKMWILLSRILIITFWWIIFLWRFPSKFCLPSPPLRSFNLLSWDTCISAMAIHWALGHLECWASMLWNSLLVLLKEYYKPLYLSSFGLTQYFWPFLF